MEYSKDQYVLCPQELIDGFKAQVMKLHPKKRRNWKGQLEKKWRQKSPVIYRPDEDTFYNKNLGEWCLIESKREAIKEMGDVEEADISPFLENFLKIKKKIEEEHLGRELNDREYDKLTTNLINIHKEKAQTGNHIPHSMRETHGYGILRR